MRPKVFETFASAYSATPAKSGYVYFHARSLFQGHARFDRLSLLYPILYHTGSCKVESLRLHR